MKYRIHTISEKGGVFIYTTSDDVIEQLDDGSTNFIKFTDEKSLEVVVPKDKVLRIIRLPDGSEEIKQGGKENE